MTKVKLVEAVVVEGKDDAANLSRFFEAEYIITHGFGLNSEIINRIKREALHKGVIIFTDPDFAGKGIRKRLNQLLTGKDYKVKHAYLSQAEATKKGNIGVENADETALKAAIFAAKAEIEQDLAIYSQADMMALGLSGQSNSKALRLAVASHFHISYGNSKEILRQLNRYQIAKTDLTAYIESLGNHYGQAE